MAKGKTFFLDTNILVDNPDCLTDFLDDPENSVVITAEVFGELDHLKTRPNVGHNARQVITHLERLAGMGNLMEGVPFPITDGDKTREGGKVSLYSRNGKEVEMKFKPNMGMDTEIVMTALNYRDQNNNATVELVTHDKNLVTLAKANGLVAEHRKSERLKTENLFSGYRYVDNQALQAKMCGAPDGNLPVSEIDENWASELIANEFVIFANDEMQMQIENTPIHVDPKIFFRYDASEQLLRPIKSNYKTTIFCDVVPRNSHQLMLTELLLDKRNVPLVTALGRAGTGKTYLCLAAALRFHYEDRRESGGKPLGKIYITRRDARDEEHGFLPGDMESKLSPLFKGIIKNYVKLARGDQNLPPTFEDAMDADVIEPMSFGDITGLTLEKEDIWIIEECQNFEAKNMKKVISRVGTGARIFVMGDLQQISNAHVREDYNGLNGLVDAIVRTSQNGEYEFGALLSTMRLVHCERSPLADWATKYL